MAIISQDAIKLGCSGGQGKIQIQTLLVLGTLPGRACHPTCTTITPTAYKCRESAPEAGKPAKPMAGKPLQT